MKDERAEIETMVRKVVTRTLGLAAMPDRRRPLIDESLLRETPVGATLTVAADAIVTPLAEQVARERRITLHTAAPLAPSAASRPGARRVAIGADHGGYELKELLKGALSADYEFIDCGTHSKDPVDYPDIAVAVARRVAGGDVWRGILIDGAGIGSCMAANKIAGVRAALCYDQATAVNSREHNNANVLTLGAGLIGPALAQQIARTWLSTEFAGGRHTARVDKIDALDGARPVVARPASSLPPEGAKPAKAPAAY